MPAAWPTAPASSNVPKDASHSLSLESSDSNAPLVRKLIDIRSGPDLCQSADQLLSSNVLTNEFLGASSPSSRPVSESLKLYVARNAATTHVINTFLDDDPISTRLTFLRLTTVQGKQILALVDTGATISVIDQRSASRLDLAALGCTQLNVQCYINSISESSNVYELELETQGHKVFSAFVTSTTRLPHARFYAPCLSEADRAFLNTAGVHLGRLRDSRSYNGTWIDMILGNDLLAWLEMASFPLPSGRTFTSTILGSFVHPEPKKDHLQWLPKKDVKMSFDASINLLYEDTPDEDDDDPASTLNRNLFSLWSMENFGIEEPSAAEEMSKLDKELIKIFEDAIVVNDEGFIEVRLPFNGKESRLANNRALALQRLRALYETLTKNVRDPSDLDDPQSLMFKYNKIIQEQLQTGIIEEVTPEMRKQETPEYFIPHKAVLKDSATTDCRIVYDASSHARGQLSLNDCQHPGPPQLQDIFGILLRVRLGRYLMVADIEKAFHQVRVQEDHRNVAKFLWLKDYHQGPFTNNVIEYRFTRIAFGITSSPFSLATSINYHLKRMEDTLLAEKISENLYVDNVFFVAQSEAELRQYYKGSKEAFKGMGMNLREYLTNSPEVMEFIPSVDHPKSSSCKLLGHPWSSLSDDFVVKVTQVTPEHPTKRDVASRMAETYDPLGLVSPLSVKFKQLIRDLWACDLKWDQKIPKQFLPAWEFIRKGFSSMAITYPRQMTTDYSYTSVELLVFCDASKDMYACVAYMHYRFKDRNPITRVAASKAKIKPTKNTAWTIPKLELIAIEIGSALARTMQTQLHMHLDAVKFFTDSKCALYWILKKEIKRVWVSNRVNSIYANRTALAALNLNPTFHHVPTDQNPADKATRGLTTTEMQTSTLWREGPKFLEDDQSTWPCIVEGKVTCPADFREVIFGEIIDNSGRVKKVKEAQMTKAQPAPRAQLILTYQCYEEVCYFLNAGTSKESRYRSFVPFDRSNSLTVIVNIMHSFFIRLMKTFPKHTWEGTPLKQFAAANPKAIEGIIERRGLVREAIIREHYKEARSMGLKFPKVLEWEEDDRGIVHLKRALRHSSLPAATKEPILIHHEHVLARLIADETHVKNVHIPAQYLISAIRTRYWIHNIGVVVKQVISGCMNCQRMTAKPYKYPYTKDLPASRTNVSTPFQHVGLDYLGPLDYDREAFNEPGKAYVLLYTCLVTRATHLEVIKDATTTEYIKALKNIFSRRGVPCLIVSDNARTFGLGAKIINEDIISRCPSVSLSELLAREQIEFKFSVALAPWQGGVWERMVGIVKNQMFKEISKVHKLNYTDLQHLIIRVEGILNNRPITANPNTEDDIVALRPADFLMPSVPLDLPFDTEFASTHVADGKTEQRTREHIEKLESALNEIWNVWIAHYLVNLQSVTYGDRKCSLLKPKKGHVVLVKTDKLPRNKWPLGRIVEVIRSEDNQTRSARVLCRGTIIHRAVCQLIPLEIIDRRESNRLKNIETHVHKVHLSNCPLPGIAGPGVVRQEITLASLKEASKRKVVDKVGTVPVSQTTTLVTDGAEVARSVPPVVSDSVVESQTTTLDTPRDDVRRERPNQGEPSDPRDQESGQSALTVANTRAAPLKKGRRRHRRDKISERPSVPRDRPSYPRRAKDKPIDYVNVLCAIVVPQDLVLSPQECRGPHHGNVWPTSLSAL